MCCVCVAMNCNALWNSSCARARATIHQVNWHPDLATEHGEYPVVWFTLVLYARHNRCKSSSQSNGCSFTALASMSSKVRLNQTIGLRMVMGRA